jgi:hypothetical protein
MSKRRKQVFRIRGFVVQPQTRQGIEGLRVEAWDNDLFFDDLVGSAMTGSDGSFQIEFDQSYFKELFFDRRPDLYFKVFQGDQLIRSTKDTTLWNVRAGEVPITIEVDLTSGGTGTNGQRRVEGHIILQHGQPAQQITVRLYSRGFGGAATLLGEAMTDERGFYTLPYHLDGNPPNLEVRAVDPQGQEISLSATKFNASKHEVLNLVAPANAQQLSPEYHRLTADLAKHVDSLDRIADAEESDERQDLTLLHRATGWDARLITLAALAQRLHRETRVPADVLYGLFRVGLPTDPVQFAQIDLRVFGKALDRAVEAGIIGPDALRLEQATAAFEEFAMSARLATAPGGGLSSVGDLLDRSGLSPAEATVFQRLYFDHHDDPETLWQRARENDLSAEKIRGLQLQGKLAYLTLNNAPLIDRLREEVGALGNLDRLVDHDLYQSDTWATLLRTLADGKEQVSPDLIPPGYAGETVAERLSAYAEDLARKVRLSFPTQVVARMVQKGELHLGEDHHTLKAPVQTFLRNADALGFELGTAALSGFIREHRDQLFEGIAPEQMQPATESIERLQRLYQITPSDEALQAMMNLGFSSAQDVVAFPADTFIERFGDQFGSPEVARLVHRKAEQVNAVVYNVLAAARQLDTTPAIYAVSPPQGVIEHTKKELIKHFPTMESLFGSLDFCECEHCRSVLSPAAYFVHLLQFLDPTDGVWESLLNDWAKKHGGAPYPFANQAAHKAFLTDWEANNPGVSAPLTTRKPCDVLLDRRLDLAYLPLTCENTHTALPYIDIVNEILEYYVAKGSLDQHSVYDTGSATTAELLAEPENIVLEAYGTLKGKEARYPMGLPFDLWTETVRRFLDHFEVPFWQVQDVLRATDELFPPLADPRPAEPAYYRADVWAEYLGIAPVEYDLLTGSNLLDAWFELYGYATEEEALTELASARTLARRLGVTYKELMELVRTSFVNPHLDSLVMLRKLAVDAVDVLRYKGHPQHNPFSPEESAAFEAHLKDVADRYGFGGTAWLQEAWEAGSFDRILVLADPEVGCNFARTTLRHADTTPANGLDFHTLNLFVRLWKKLGWTIEETDRALQVFVPFNARPLTAATLAPALRTALVYIAHLEQLGEQLKIRQGRRIELLTLWSDLPTRGAAPLYAKLFLVPSLLKNDAVFDHPHGDYLSSTDVLLKNHMLAVQSALNLSADEIRHILTQAEEDPEKTVLSLATVSLLYRHGLLARALKISVRDLVALKELSGLDPFKPLSPDPLAVLADDHPFVHTLRFVEIAEHVRANGFAVDELDYLLRHRYDPVGKHRADAAALLALVRTLAGEIRRIRGEHAVPDDALAFTDDVLAQNLSLVFSPDIVATFMAMWTGTIEYPVFMEGVDPGDRLDPEFYIQGPIIGVSYDDGTQRLTCRGVLLDHQRAELEAKLPASDLLSTLLDEVQAQAREFFRKHFVDVELPLFRAEDLDLFFAPIAAELPPNDQQQLLREKRNLLAQALLPSLQRRLIQQLVVQTLTAGHDSDRGLTEALLTNVALLTAPREPGRSLLDAFAGAGQAGLSVTYLDGKGDPLEVGIVQDLDTLGGPAGTDGVRFNGFVEVPTSGAYRFFLILGRDGAQAELWFDHLAGPALRQRASTDSVEFDRAVELTAGIPYRFSVRGSDLGEGHLRVLVRGENLPKGSVGRLTLYPETVVKNVEHSDRLLRKVLHIVQRLGLTEREVRYLLTHGQDFGGLDLSRLPIVENSEATDAAPELFGQLMRLVDYARLRGELTGATDEVIRVFENARRVYPASTNANEARDELLTDLTDRVASLTRRDASTVSAAMVQMDMTAETALLGDELWVEAPALINEVGVMRLWRLLQVVSKLGVPVDALARWSVRDRDFVTAQDLRNTVKARYEHDAWQRVAQPISEKLRQSRRDALAAHVMHRLGFERMEELFEYFLIDPGMEPVVQTSRVRLAISSVQIFIQRCLLNLEPKVHPSAINAKHWQWLKRHRVWEANRKIFLYPENWLEPEFRDDKSHLFRELEGTLLQEDVSRDAAEDAFSNYLKKLDELARVDIVTMYCEENPLDPAANTVHVIGRTFSLPHKYFYRRYTRQLWTPWEPVPIDIEGDHVVAIMWRDRLNLFWVTFLEKAEPKDANALTGGKGLVSMNFRDLVTTAGSGTKRLVDVQLNWSEYFEGEWTTSEASGFIEPSSIEVKPKFDRRMVFVHADKRSDGGNGEIVRIFLVMDSSTTRSGARASYFEVVGRNSPPDLFHGILVTPLSPYRIDNPYEGTRLVGNGPLAVRFLKRITTEGGKTTNTFSTDQILRQGGAHSIISSSDPYTVGSQELLRLARPFFYQDRRHTYFVEPRVGEVRTKHWNGWVIEPPKWGLDSIGDWWDRLPVQVRFPVTAPVHSDFVDPAALFGIHPVTDWLSGQPAYIEFGGRPVGASGGAHASTIPSALAAGVLGDSASLAVGAVVIGPGGLNAATLTALTGTRAGIIDPSVSNLPATPFHDITT